MANTPYACGGKVFGVYHGKNAAMCGIVGYIGIKEAAPVLLKRLKKLEYRGYDSAGIAVLGGGGLRVCKSKGLLKNLEEKVAALGVSESGVPPGIGHTPLGYPRRALGY